MATPLHILAKVPSGDALANVFTDLLAGVPFNDVTFYAPTGQLPGAVKELRAVHANSRILKMSSAYFRKLLDDLAPPAFSQCPDKPNDPASADRERDSDAASFEEKDFDDLESVLAAQSEVSWLADKDEGPSDHSAHSGEGVPVISVYPTRTITLSNVSAETLEATIFYIYAGKVNFQPLPPRSAEICDKKKAAHALTPQNQPACSCKEVYRFADEAGLDELKELADAHLFAQLTADNILEEVFSPFSEQYPHILRRQVTLLLAQHWTPTTRAALGPTIEKVVRGEMSHAAPALTMLLGELTPAVTPSAAPVAGRPVVASPSAETKRAEPSPASASTSASFPANHTPAIQPSAKPLSAAPPPLSTSKTSVRPSPKDRMDSWSTTCVAAESSNSPPTIPAGRPHRVPLSESWKTHHAPAKPRYAAAKNAPTAAVSWRTTVARKAADTGYNSGWD